ncbi:putative mediator complex, subunit Med11 [Helianthus anomalus]
MHRCNVSKLLTRVLELAGGLMEEFAIPSGPRKELINNHCSEFMQLINKIFNNKMIVDIIY